MVTGGIRTYLRLQLFEGLLYMQEELLSALEALDTFNYFQAGYGRSILSKDLGQSVYRYALYLRRRLLIG